MNGGVWLDLTKADQKMLVRKNRIINKGSLDNHYLLIVINLSA